MDISADMPAARDRLLRWLSEFSATPKPDDIVFEDLFKDTKSLMQAYANEPFNMAILEKAERLVEKFDGIDAAKASSTTYGRSRVNTAVISSRIRRTHYAAYLAGRNSTSPELGPKFKVWMHNAAANGALSLYEAIRQLSGKVENDPNIQVLEAFGEAARRDALHFLYLADDHDATAVVSRYNHAKIDITSGEESRIKLSIDQLLSIKPPQSDCDPPDLTWHINNYDCFRGPDMYLHSIIDRVYPNASAMILNRLENNSKESQTIKELRGDSLWAREAKINKALIIGTSVGLVAIGMIAMNDEVWSFLAKAVELTTDLMFSSYASDTSAGQLLAGDGGVAAKLLRVSLGDGGLA